MGESRNQVSHLCLICEAGWVPGVRSLWLYWLSLNRKSQQVSYLMCVRSCKQAAGRHKRDFRESLGKRGGLQEGHD